MSYFEQIEALVKPDLESFQYVIENILDSVNDRGIKAIAKDLQIDTADKVVLKESILMEYKNSSQKDFDELIQYLKSVNKMDNLLLGDGLNTLSSEEFEKKVFEHIKTQAKTQNFYGALWQDLNTKENWKEDFVKILKDNKVTSLEDVDALIQQNEYWRNQHSDRNWSADKYLISAGDPADQISSIAKEMDDKADKKAQTQDL